MDYPNDFNVPTFSAGKTVALTRSVSVWISIVFFLIIVACGFLLLGRHLRKNVPFLISVDPITDEWTVIAYPHEEKKVQQYQYIQEKLVKDFVKDWFTISDNQSVNEEIWKRCSKEECGCSIDDCDMPQQFNPLNKTCALSCKSSDAVFEDFSIRVLKDYKERIKQAGETWTVPKKGILITPNIVTENFSRWQVFVTVVSSVSGKFNALVFVDVNQDNSVDYYSSTFGYYIEQFNAYRIQTYNE